METETEELLSDWRPVDLKAVLDGTDTADPPNVLRRADGVALLYPGRINALQGETESAKSWAAQIAAVQEMINGRHVIYVDFEDSPAGVVERMISMGMPPDLILEHLHYIIPETGFYSEGATETLAELIIKHGPPSLMVIDGVTEAMMLDRLNPDVGVDVARFHRGLPRWAAATGATVVLIDHVVKAKDSRGRWATGSERKLSGISGAALIFTTITPFGRGKTGRFTIEVAKDRPGYVREHASGKKLAELQLISKQTESGTYTVDYTLKSPIDTRGPDGQWRPELIMEKVSKALEQAPDGLTHNQLLDLRTEGTKTPKVYWNQAIDALLAEGFIQVRPGPRNAQIHASIRPFRTEQPD
jgi:hypothetical protein